MATGITIESVSFDRATNGFYIIAETDPVETANGSLRFDPRRSEVGLAWNDFFVMDEKNRAYLSDALKAIRRNILTARLHGKRETRLVNGKEVQTYQVVDLMGASITYRLKEGNPLCDDVSVHLLTPAGTSFDLTIAAEDGVNIFVKQALAYLGIEKNPPSPPIAFNP